MTTNPSMETDSKDVHKHICLHWPRLELQKRHCYHNYEPVHGNLIFMEALLSLPSLLSYKFKGIEAVSQRVSLQSYKLFFRILAVICIFFVSDSLPRKTVLKKS